MNYDMVYAFLACHWFNDRRELRKARALLLKYFPDNRDFLLRYMFHDCDEDIITAEDLKQFIYEEDNFSGRGDG